MELPPLTGSDKQIAWATTLRAEFLGKARESLLARYPAEQFAAAEDAFIHSITRRTDASWWIDARDMDPGEYAQLDSSLSSALSQLRQAPTGRPMIFLDPALLASPTEVPGWREIVYDGPRTHVLKPGQAVWLHPEPGIVEPLLDADVRWASAWDSEALRWLEQSTDLPEIAALWVKATADRNPRFVNSAVRDAIDRLAAAHDVTYARLATPTSLTAGAAEAARQRNEGGVPTQLVTVDGTLSPEHIAEVAQWLRAREGSA